MAQKLQEFYWKCWTEEVDRARYEKLLDDAFLLAPLDIPEAHMDVIEYGDAAELIDLCHSAATKEPLLAFFESVAIEPTFQTKYEQFRNDMIAKYGPLTPEQIDVINGGKPDQVNAMLVADNDGNPIGYKVTTWVIAAPTS
jgi:hypothetical protein